MGGAPYRFDELGCMQFERLCLALLEDALGVSTAEWRELRTGCAVLLPDGLADPPLRGPTVAVITWIRDPDSEAARLRVAAVNALDEWPAVDVPSVLVLTNGTVAAPQGEGVEVVTLGPAQLTRLVDDSWPVRLAFPSVLGIGAADDLAANGSTFDLDAARALARVFVPTRPYTAALDVLVAHRFVVLTGPPEMGKTAIARMIGLAALSDGWEVHECIRPEQLWSRFRSDRRQVFVADDAFGSTEYRPEAADRWALDLDRVLRAMDERHWLVWTSRPAPLKAGLRRIHREHGVERFPQPAEVQVDASALDVAEKALILFRHAKAAGLPAPTIEVVRKQGWTIVDHPHFTPERIRRFVDGRPFEHGTEAGRDVSVETIIAAELREPTEAMAESYRALSPEHRGLLLALLDTPPGPTSERHLVGAFRRHGGAGLSRHPHELVDRLTDHFLRIGEAGAVTWVHPSWRDLVIEELGRDGPARREFLGSARIDGILLALSTEGGAAGERRLPLLREDADWDALSDRLAGLVPTLDDPELARLLVALAEARRAVAGPSEERELDALRGYVLELLARRWENERAILSVSLLAAWFGLAQRLDDPPAPPGIAPTWVELAPRDAIDPMSQAELTRFDEWTALADVLSAHAPDQLAAFRFPDAHRGVIRDFVEALDGISRLAESFTAAQRDVLWRCLRRLAALAPDDTQRAGVIGMRLAHARDEHELPETYVPRKLSPELKRILEARPVLRDTDKGLVARVLRDL